MKTKIGFVLAILFFSACVFLVQKQPGGWNDASRLAAIESLVERGTWSIEDSTWLNFTGDKIVIADVFYSDKMPVLSLLGAGAYATLRAFGGSAAQNCAEVARFCAYAPLTLMLVSLPAAALVYLFFDYASRQSVAVWAAAVGTIALSVGTMIFPYATVLNHHIPAAASVFASFYVLMRGHENPRGLFAAGFFAALAISFDVLAGVSAATLFGIALMRYRARAYFFVLGALIPLAATALLDYQIGHTLLPPYMVTDAYNYPGSSFPASIAGNGTPDDYGAYAFRMFLGARGLFAYNPLLLFAFVGAVGAGVNRQRGLRVEGWLTALGFVLLCVYLATQTGNFGGSAYGERWFIVSIPILFAFIFFVPPLNAGNWTPALHRTPSGAWESAVWILFAPMLALSILSSIQGTQSPWDPWLPPLQITRDLSKFPYLGFRWNIQFP